LEIPNTALATASTPSNRERGEVELPVVVKFTGEAPVKARQKLTDENPGRDREVR
jgi:hypothetical protein